MVVKYLNERGLLLTVFLLTLVFGIFATVFLGSNASLDSDNLEGVLTGAVAGTSDFSEEQNVLEEISVQDSLEIIETSNIEDSDSNSFDKKSTDNLEPSSSKSIIEKIVDFFSLSGNSLTGGLTVGMTAVDGPSELGITVNVDSCKTINSNISIVTLISNISATGDCFLLNTDNITINGDGYSIIGPGNGSEVGIDIGAFTNITVKNLTIDNFSNGIGIGDATNITIRDVNIQNSTSDGIMVYGTADYVVIRDSVVENSGANGINAETNPSNDIYIFDSTIRENNHTGISIKSSNGTINNTYVYNNSEEGINVMSGSDEFVIKNSVVYNNSLEGIKASLSTMLELEYLEIIDDELSLGSINNSNVSDVNITRGYLELEFETSTNFFENIYIEESGSYSIYDNTPSSSKNTVTYTNDYGWFRIYALNNLTLNSTLMLGNPIILEDNNIGFEMNSSYLIFNVSTQMEIYNLNYSSEPDLYKDGSLCSSPYCNTSYYNGTGLSDGILYANVTGFSNYTTVASSSNVSCEPIVSDFSGLTQDVTNGTCFAIEASDLTFDMMGYTLSSNGSGVAFIIGNATNVSIINGSVEDYRVGIFASNITELNIQKLSFSNNTENGIEVENTVLAYIENNTLTNNNLTISEVNYSNLTSLDFNYGSLLMLGSSSENRIENLSVVTDDSYAIYDETGNSNKNVVLFENDFGGIGFVNIENATVSSDFNVGNPIILENNTVGVEVNDSFLNWNMTSVIEIRNLSYSSTPYLYKDGVRCDDTDYCNISFYNGGAGEDILFANVTGFSTYTTGSSVYCDEIDHDHSIEKTTVTNGTCFSIMRSNIVFDMNGSTFSSNMTGFVFYVGNSTNVTIKNGIISDYEDGIQAYNMTNLNISNMTFFNLSDTAIEFTNSNYSVISDNNFYNLTLAFNISESENNSIYNNIFNATSNVVDDGYNFYNITYSCTDGYSNILGKNCTGGNYWNDYAGADDGTGSGYPHNVSNDTIGDTSLPYDNGGLISTGGDYLPLLYCSEIWSCTSWSSCSSGTQTRTCTDSNACGTTLAKPTTSQSCTSSSGGGSSSSTDTTTEENATTATEETTTTTEEDGVGDILDGSTSPDESVDRIKVGVINGDIPESKLIYHRDEIDEVKRNFKVEIIKREVIERDEGAIRDGLFREDDRPYREEPSGEEKPYREEPEERPFIERFIPRFLLEPKEPKLFRVVDDEYDARREADIPREKLTLKLENTGDKYMVLRPFASQGMDGPKFIVIRKIYEGRIDEGRAFGLSGDAPSDDFFKATLGAIDYLVLPPGESEIEVEVTAGFSSFDYLPVTVAFYQSEDGIEYSDEAIYTEILDFEQEITTAASVVPNDDNTIDVYAVIMQEKLPRKLAKAIAIAEAESGEELYDVSDKNQYLELNFRELSSEKEGNYEGKLSTWYQLLGNSNDQVIFSDVYGPYDITGQLKGVMDKEGFTFAQKFAYDPEQLNGDLYAMDIRVYGASGEIYSESFLLDLDSDSEIEESIEEYNSNVDSRIELESDGSDLSESSISGFDLTGAVTFKDLVSVAYEQTEDAALIVYHDVAGTKDAKIAIIMLVVLVMVCLGAFVFGPGRLAITTAAKEMKSKEFDFGFTKDLNDRK